MSTRRESWFRCTFETKLHRFTGLVRAWSSEAAADQFQTTMRGMTHERGTTTVEPAPPYHGATVMTSVPGRPHYPKNGAPSAGVVVHETNTVGAVKSYSSLPERQAPSIEDVEEVLEALNVEVLPVRLKQCDGDPRKSEVVAESF